MQNPWNWNSVPRIALAISIIEDGDLTIDEYRNATGDLAYFEGRFYSDKAPGLAIMAIPSVAAGRMYLKKLDEEIKWITNRGKVTEDFIFLEQFATIMTSGLITALTALLLYFTAIRLGAGQTGAVFAALTYGLATPAWGWATAFFSHNAAGGFLFMGFACVFFLLNSERGKNKDILLGFAAGAFLSWAVVTELTAALASMAVALYGLFSARKWERDRMIRVVVSAFAGWILFISPLLIHNYMITGNPFSSLYGYTVAFPKLKSGFYGLSTPDLEKIRMLLFSGKLGILWFSPLLLAVPFALYKLWKIQDQKPLAVLIVAIALYYLIWNSSFAYWTGGGSTGPRYLTPMLPFLCLPLAVLWGGTGRNLRLLMVVLFAVSFLISLFSVSVSMTLQYRHENNIITNFLIPEFLEAKRYQISLPVRMLISPFTSESYKGHVVLFPLFAIMTAFGSYIIYRLRKCAGAE